MERRRSKDLLDWMGISGAPDWTVARPLGGLVSLLLALLFAGALVAAFVLIGRTIVGEGGAGSTLGTGALIVALLGAPVLVWSTVLKHQTVRYQKEGHITDRITSAVEQLGAEKTVKKDGVETTEPNIEVRIGAILSLERIAQDSTRYDKGRDHVRVMEILCAYIRENSNATPPQDFPEPEWEPLKNDATEAERAAHLEKRQERFGVNFSQSKAYQWAQSLRQPRADIVQALLVLGRRTADQRKVEAAWPDPPDEGTEWVFDRPCPELPDIEDGETRDPAQIKAFKKKLDDWKETLRAYAGYRLDLRGSNLQRAALSAKRPDRSDAVFAGALMHDARLEGANLIRARIEGANLSRVRMEGASLSKARMEGAKLRSARMEGAYLADARMEGADLTNARMEGAALWLVRMVGTELIGVSMEAADLRYGHMEGANGVGSRMEGASLSGARIQGADFRSARMEGANLSDARMEGAELGFARMQGANLSEARMDKTTDWTGVSLSGANVRSVDFRETTISEEQIKTAFGDGSTKLPEDFQRPAHWPEAGLDWRNFHTEYQEWLQNPGAYTPPPPERGEAEAADDEETPEPPA